MRATTSVGWVNLALADVARTASCGAAFLRTLRISWGLDMALSGDGTSSGGSKDVVVVECTRSEYLILPATRKPCSLLRYDLAPRR